MSPKRKTDELIAENDLNAKSEKEIQNERQIMANRAERVRRRLTMNQAFLPRNSPAEKNEKSGDE